MSVSPPLATGASTPEAALAALLAPYYLLGFATTLALAFTAQIVIVCTIWSHLRSYFVSKEQRYIIRILLLIFMVAGVGAFGYLPQDAAFLVFARAGTDGYQSVAVASFLILILNYVSQDKDRQHELAGEQGKRRLCIPFWWGRLQPKKAYFLWALKASQVQFIVIKMVLVVVTCLTAAAGKYDTCPSPMSPECSLVYINLINGISASIAIMGLIALYRATALVTRGRRLVFKFLCVKLIIGLPFTQQSLLGLLFEQRVIREPAFLLALNASLTSFEMLLIALLASVAFSAAEYRDISSDSMTMQRALSSEGPLERISLLRAIIDVLNFRDLLVLIWTTLRFFVDAVRGKEYTRARYGGETANSDFSYGPEDLDFYKSFGLTPFIIDPSKEEGEEAYAKVELGASGSSYSGGTTLYDPPTKDVEVEDVGFVGTTISDRPSLHLPGFVPGLPRRQDSYSSLFSSRYSQIGTLGHSAA